MERDCGNSFNVTIGGVVIHIYRTCHVSGVTMYNCAWCQQEATEWAYGLPICSACFQMLAQEVDERGLIWDCVEDAESGSEKPTGMKTLE